jgi:hypothetical protein
VKNNVSLAGLWANGGFVNNFTWLYHFYRGSEWLTVSEDRWRFFLNTCESPMQIFKEQVNFLEENEFRPETPVLIIRKMQNNKLGPSPD